jgi:hypothetical protein
MNLLVIGTARKACHSNDQAPDAIQKEISNAM